MPHSERLPSVVIVGRPNVGKSTLFNAILGQRRAIVGDEPGITRDRIHGVADHRGRKFELIDTGGIVPDEVALIPSEILKQARVVLETAAHIIFLVDGRSELTAADRDLGGILRRLGKPMSLAVNKIDTMAREDLAHEFHSLGIADLFPVSAEHRMGIAELLDHITENFAWVGDESEKAREPQIRVAIIGRPNVGKSTLLNTLTGQERAIVSPVAGTTRDSVDESVMRGGMRYTFVDTAGIRRKGKTHLMAEKLSVVMARRSMRMADVVLLLLDVTEGVLALDATIAGYAHEEGQAIVIVVNKWDAAGEKGRRKFEENLRDELKFLDYARVAFVSAKARTGLNRLFPMIREAYEGACQRVTTGELNRFAQTLKLEPDRKIRYITQASVRPPTFVLFTDRKQKLHFSTERFLMNRLREKFGFKGTPIVVKLKKKG
jgi:GTP-binding protein